MAYTQIATIATDDHHTLQEFRASVGAQWTFLSDPGRTVQQDLDIAEYTDPEHNPMIPHTLVLKPGLVIHSVYNGYWFWGRPSFYDLWHDLRAATSEIRPDWDLSTPGSAKPGTRATTRSFTAGTGGPPGRCRPRITDKPALLCCPPRGGRGGGKSVLEAASSWPDLTLASAARVRDRDGSTS